MLFFSRCYSKILHITLRAFSYVLQFIPNRIILYMGCILGDLVYFISSKYRKRTLNQLAIAADLHLNQQQKEQIARKSFQNLIITTLEYFRLPYWGRCIKNNVVFKNFESISEIYRLGRGIIFVSAHQANWEIPFIYVTQKLPGVAIGRPIKNKTLYDWILKSRMQFKGEIIEPKNAVEECLKKLKQGKFVGIVGDQALPESSYSYPFFGVRAWTSASPAVLAYRANTPIIFIENYRSPHDGKYYISCYPPIYPNIEAPLKLEVVRMMNILMKNMEKSISHCPEQWLWQHKRWKQRIPCPIKSRYLHDFIAIVFPADLERCYSISEDLAPLLQYYPRSFFTIIAPEGIDVILEDPELWIHKVELSQKVMYKGVLDKHDLPDDWKIQMVLDFSKNTFVEKHFTSLATVHYFAIDSLSEAKIFKTSITHSARL